MQYYGGRALEIAKKIVNFLQMVGCESGLSQTSFCMIIGHLGMKLCYI